MLSWGDMARVLIDDSQWPLVLITWPEHPVTDEDVDVFVAERRKQVPRGKHVTLHLTEGGSGLRSRQRRRMAEYLREDAELVRGRLLASALVARNPVIRGMITALSWLTSPPFTQRVFADRASAEAWLSEVLVEAGVWSAPSDPRQASR